MRLILDELVLTKKPFGKYEWRMRSKDSIASFTTEPDLGLIQAGVSACMKTLVFERTGHTGWRGDLMDVKASGVRVTEWTIVPCASFPFRWTMRMVALGRPYECQLAPLLDHVLTHFTGLSNFFAFHGKVITVDDGVVRNREQAAKAGLLTKEDG